jgi:hypothetical protein
MIRRQDSGAGRWAGRLLLLLITVVLAPTLASPSAVAALVTAERAFATASFTYDQVTYSSQASKPRAWRWRPPARRARRRVERTRRASEDTPTRGVVDSARRAMRASALEEACARGSRRDQLPYRRRGPHVECGQSRVAARGASWIRSCDRRSTV